MHCTGGHGWSAPEANDQFGVVLVRDGLFRRQVDGVPEIVDASSFYLATPGTEERFDHPCGADVCTALTLPAELLGSLGDPERRLTRRVLPLPAGFDLRHRRLLARAAYAEPFELSEHVLALVGDLFAVLAKETPAHGRGQTSFAVNVRVLLHVEPALRLSEMAKQLGVAPYTLSRAFRSATGITISRYRRRMRTHRALELLHDGLHDLAQLASECGFADQSHLTRAVREEYGATPARLRALLCTEE